MPDEPVSLDLVARELIAPRLVKTALVSTAVGVLLAVLLSFVVSATAAIITGLIVGVPLVLVSIVGLRVRITLTDNVIHVRRVLGSRHVDASKAVSVELLVRVSRVNRVLLRISDENSSATIGLAMYIDDAGRELNARGQRGLADALAAGDLVPAAAMASVLVQQLRAEARDAVLGERPLYRAMRVALDAGRSGQTTLTDAEVASLVD